MSATQYDDISKTWFGPKREFTVDKTKSFGEIIFEKIFAEDSDRIMQIDGDTGECMTLKEVRLNAIRCAKNLSKINFTQNDRIAIIARNHHHLTPLTLAALFIGCPIAPLDVYHVNDGLSNIIRRIEPSLIFCDTDVLLRVAEIARECENDSKIFSVNGTVAGYDNIDCLLQKNDDDTSFKCNPIEDACTHAAVIACSSGSTGLPKSILMSHALFNYTFSSRFDKFNFNTLCFSSLYWFSGVWQLLNSVFSNSVRIFTAKCFSPELLFDLATKYKVELFAGPPCQIQSVFKNEHYNASDLESLKLIISIGGYLPSNLIQKLNDLLPTCILLTTYGMTEIGGSASMTMPKELEKYPGTVGRLVAGTELKLLNETTEENCGPNEKGEILVRTPIPCLGYYKDDEMTRISLDENGFFKSGDIGYFDDNGYLYIVGRKKEIFKNCGFAIWPNEIENVLVANTEIQNACVVGVYDDKQITELPAAVVVKQKNSSITEQELFAFVAERFAEYKHLTGGIYFVDSLPMTPSDKIVRSKVKQIAQQFFDDKSNQSN